MRSPVGSPGDTDGGIRVAFIVAADPVTVVVSDSRKSDHRPADHVLVAAMDRIRKKAFGHIFQQCVEEAARIGFVEFDIAGLDLLEHVVLLVCRKLGEYLAALARLAIFVEASEALAIKLGWRERGLR